MRELKLLLTGVLALAALSVHAQGGVDASDEYKARAMASIRTSVEPSSSSPAAWVDMELSTQDGRIARVKVLNSSGNRAWDTAVAWGLSQAGPLPKDADGRVPHRFKLRFDTQVMARAK
ncbi:TonB C-terminal domain-containing protein [Ottowia sp.]|uniref:TonB C-terminal domain-containing protein n=1 Tax=Ottowia sp. TaxID=1898956 RepID=UPI0025D2514E|nr:TonB C-terminal domain-containing protein [Ottowia sp.]MBK6616606.1 TonB C-terminal domain-containing protein [Ottowia sp.]